MAIPTTQERVPAHTSDTVNERIERRRLASYPAEIQQRLKELEAEWDIERAIEANASALAFIGVALASSTTPIGSPCQR